MPWGAYAISVPEVVLMGNVTKAVFVGRDDNVREVCDSAQIKYVTQHRLTVLSPMGNPKGSGWYDAGSSATFSVTSPVSVEGLMGVLGGKYVFDHWSGDSTAASSVTSITMDGSKTVTAEWRIDNTVPYAIAGAIGTAIMIIVAALLLVKRRK